MPILGDLPIEGEEVYPESSNGAIRFGKQLGNGGEGFIYETNTEYVAKIYKKEKLTQRKVAKLKCMLQKKLNYELGVCFPICALYNAQHEFIGILQPKAKGEKLN